MKFCKYCGVQVSDDTVQCPRCGGHIGVAAPDTAAQKAQCTPAPQKAPARAKRRKLLAAAGAVAAVIVVVCIIRGGGCRASGCHNRAVSGMHYCYTHKCAVADCDSGRFLYSNYCYSHYLLYDDDAAASSVSAYDLRISNVTLSSNSLYTVAEGSVTNTSDRTVTFVKVKGSFKNSSGSVVDTDWTYAVGAEGLSPGESYTWRMSVKKNPAIRECSVSVIDFDT